MRKLFGFSHVDIIQLKANHKHIMFECGHRFANMSTVSECMDIHKDITTLRIVTLPSKKVNVTRFGFQSCTTLIQYIAGIALGCLTPQSLYATLTKACPQWLKSRGVISVEEISHG